MTFSINKRILINIFFNFFHYIIIREWNYQFLFNFLFNLTFLFKNLWNEMEFKFLNLNRRESMP